MADGSIDRKAWADVVTQLIASESNGNKSQFGQLVGVTYKTVLRWTRGDVDVSEESVRQVARALHVSPLELLLRVGYYTTDDLDAARAAATRVDVVDDPALRVILEAEDVPPRAKQQMIQRLHQLRTRESERQADEVAWWIEQRRGT